LVERKQRIHDHSIASVRLDGDVIDWFKGQGHGYQTRMNAVLRRFIEAQKNPQR
jgi:uncharacterized protein (DUF4415 family)